MNSNGILSFGGPFSSHFPRNFDNVFSFVTLAAPFWSDIDLTRFGCMFHRMANDSDSLTRAAGLTDTYFPDFEIDIDFVVVVTWYKVAEARSSSNAVSILIMHVITIIIIIMSSSHIL